MKCGECEHLLGKRVRIADGYEGGHCHCEVQQRNRLPYSPACEPMAEVKRLRDIMRKLCSKHARFSGGVWDEARKALGE